jgi:hypothetical protein
MIASLHCRLIGGNKNYRDAPMSGLIQVKGGPRPGERGNKLIKGQHASRIDQGERRCSTVSSRLPRSRPPLCSRSRRSQPPMKR